MRAVVDLVFLAIKLGDKEKCDEAKNFLKKELSLRPHNILLRSSQIALEIYQSYKKIDPLMSKTTFNGLRGSAALFVLNDTNTLVSRILVGALMDEPLKKIVDIVSVTRKNIKSWINPFLKDDDKSPFLGNDSAFSLSVRRMKAQLSLMNYQLMRQLGQDEIAEKYHQELQHLVDKKDWVQLQLIQNKKSLENETEKIRNLIFLGYIEPVHLQGTITNKISSGGQSLPSSGTYPLDQNNSRDDCTAPGHFELKDYPNLIQFPPKKLTVYGDFLVEDHELESLSFEALTVYGDMMVHGCSCLESLSKVLRVGGQLRLENCEKLKVLPEKLTVVKSLILDNCPNLEELSNSNIIVGVDLLTFQMRNLKTIGSLWIGADLLLGGCRSLTNIGKELIVKGNIDFRNCTSLQKLPENLQVGGWLDASDCTSLKAVPAKFRVDGGALNLASCTGLTSLPEGLSVGDTLDLSSCTGLTNLPEDLSVGGNLSLIDCQEITSLPPNIFSWGIKTNGETRRIYLKGSGIHREKITDNPVGMVFDFDLSKKRYYS